METEKRGTALLWQVLALKYGSQGWGGRNPIIARWQLVPSFRVAMGDRLCRPVLCGLHRTSLRQQKDLC